jgi:hypothetical protein
MEVLKKYFRKKENVPKIVNWRSMIKKLSSWSAQGCAALLNCRAVDSVKYCGGYLLGIDQ